MPSLFFYLCSAVMVAFGLGVVVSRNPVTSALSLVVSFLGLAALLVTLDAYFIAVIQVLVYAGAVMVLFLFIIMLLDVKAEERRRFNLPALAGGAAVALLIAWQVAAVVTAFGPASARAPALDYAGAAAARAEALGAGPAARDGIIRQLAADPPSLPDVHLIGETIFTRYPLHLQVVAVLLLVATLGVVVLSKRKLA